jgi:hypothetical protein
LSAGDDVPHVMENILTSKLPHLKPLRESCHPRKMGRIAGVIN